jgi:hypothetical protein
MRGLHDTALDRYVETGRRSLSWEGLELAARHRSGREIPVEVSFGAFRREDGTLWFTGIVRDISDRRELEDAFHEAHDHLRSRVAEQAAELDVLRDEIAAIRRFPR